MATIKKSILILIIILICIVFDQSSKLIAKEYLQSANTIAFLHDTFRLHYTENTGALLSLGESLSENARFWIFIVFVFLMLTALVIYAYTIPLHFRNKIAGFSLIAGGGISNLIDRITNNGTVIDFMNVGIGSVRTGIFNVADLLILLGIATVLIFHSHKSGNIN